MSDLEERLDPEDMTALREALGKQQQATVNVQRAQQALQGARDRLMEANGGHAAIQRLLTARYHIGEGDAIDPRTGVITRAAKPEPPADEPKSNGHATEDLAALNEMARLPVTP